MNLTLNVFVFVAALVLGGLGSALFADGPQRDANALTAESLVGTWTGNFGRDNGDCTIEITRVEGDALYGTLEKEGYLIRFEGYFNRETRKFYFEETSILRLAAHRGEWSLGRNSATVSADGRFMMGDGYDKWGQYSFAVTSYQPR